MKWSATVKFWDSFWRPIINCILGGRLVNDVYPHKIWDFVLDPGRCIDSEMFWSPNLVLLSLHNRQQRRARVADKSDDSLSNFWIDVFFHFVAIIFSCWSLIACKRFFKLLSITWSWSYVFASFSVILDSSSVFFYSTCISVTLLKTFVKFY